MNTNLLFLSILIILITIILTRYFVINIEKIYKFLFSLRYSLKNFFGLKKQQNYFYTLEKYMENLTVSGKKYLKTNNYIFKRSNVNSISTIFSKYKILILRNKTSNFFKYKLGNEIYNENLSNRSVNFLKIKTDNKKFNILEDKNNEILKVFHINKNKKKLVLILFVDGMSNYLSSNLNNSLNYFGKTNQFSKVFSNAPWTLPAFSNLITGQYTSTHLNYSPKSYYSNDREINQISKIKSKLTIFEYFQNKGFVTGCYSPYVRINPTYNFDRGVDIFKHCEGSSADEIIDDLIAQIEFFKDTSNFIFAHFFDVHHKQKMHDRLSDFIYQSEKNFDYIKLNKTNKKKSVKRVNNKKLETFLKQKNFSEEMEIINRIKLVDFRLQRLYNYLRTKKFDDYSIILMGDHGTRLNSLNPTGNILDKYHQNIGFFIKDKKIKNFSQKKKNYIETIDIFPSLISKYGSVKSRSIIKQINGKNSLFSNMKKENVFSESLYTSDYNLLINDQESYQYSSYKINNNKITSHIETKYYDKNQKEVITKNKKFPFNKLKKLEKQHIRNSKIKK